MKRKLFFMAIMTIGVIFTSCTYSAYVEPEIIIPDEPISYSVQIQPIFNKSCIGCHPSSGNLNLTEGNSYESLMAKPGRVDTLNPPVSIILTKPASNGNHFGKYNSQEELLVFTWIEEGAKNN